jgi:hypothetical protein
MFDVKIFKHSFKKIVVKVLPPITDQNSRGSKPSENIFFQEITTVLASLATHGIASTHLVT